LIFSQDISTDSLYFISSIIKKLVIANFKETQLNKMVIGQK
jgi:hypothetical protein